MTPQQLGHLEQLVGDATRLRNRIARVEAVKRLILELDNPLPGGVVKIAEIRMSANGTELRFLDLSNQSRNATLEVSTEDGRKLVGLVIEYLNKQAELLVSKLDAIPYPGIKVTRRDETACELAEQDKAAGDAG